MTKDWYTSKTLWVNTLGIAAIIAQGQFGYVIDPAAQASLLLLINMLLRMITKEQIVWKKTDA